MAKNPRGHGTRGPALKEDLIDWDEFFKLAEYDCYQKEVADFFNIDVSTLENYYFDKFNEKLSDFWDKKKGGARAKLKKIQWQQAEGGSTAMAIFLGKHLLGQSDKPIDVRLMEAINESGLTVDQVIVMIHERQNEVRKKGLKTFTEFVIDAGYPEPFAKQIEMLDFMMKNEVPRLLLGARGVGKTDYVTILGTAYDIYLHPLSSTTLILTKSTERNGAIVNEIQYACEKNGIVFEKANTKFIRVSGLLGKDHTVSTVTLGTKSLRGRHPKRIIMDDPVTEDDTSEATRKLAEKKYYELMKLVSNLVVIGQPAHKYDLYAKLKGLLLKMEVPHGTIPELDHDLEAQRAAGVSEASIQASYHLKILNEGATPFDNIQYIDKFPEGQCVAFIDPSHKGGDYTAITLFKGHFDNIAVLGFVWQKAWNHCLDDIVDLIKTRGVIRLAFETNNLGDQPLEILQNALSIVDIRIGIVGINSTHNKHSRIMAAGTFAHKIMLAKESSQTYQDHVVQYEYNAAYDDAPDSLASGLEWLGLIRGKKGNQQ